MRKKIYLACAMLGLTAFNAAHAQYVIDSNLNIEEPASWGAMGTEKEVMVVGATITFTADAFNVCGLPAGDGTSITLTEGAKIVMFDSPDLWSPDLDAPENGEFIDDLLDLEGNAIIKMPYNFVIDGAATINADSKCRIGGKYTGTGDLTLMVGDSTALCADFSEFAGKLIIQHKGANNTFLLGDGYPGQRPGDAKPLTSNATYGSMPWDLVIPDGLNITTLTPMALVMPKIVGKGHIKVDHYFVFRPRESSVFDCTVEGSGINETSPRYFEYFASAGVGITMAQPIEYATAQVYIRAGDFGFYFNTDPSVPTLSNVTGSISMRNNGAFVGGTGFVDCGVDGKDGVASRITPGEFGENSIGTLKIKELWLNNNNAINVDFGGNGVADKLICDTIHYNGAFTRLYINLTPEFFADPKPGDYKIVDAYKTTTYSSTNEETGEVTVGSLVNVAMFTTVDDEGVSTPSNQLPEGMEWNFDKFFTEGVVTITGEAQQSVEGDVINKTVVSREYFSINGTALEAPMSGFNVVRTVYSDGTVNVNKVFQKD